MHHALIKVNSETVKKVNDICQLGKGNNTISKAPGNHSDNHKWTEKKRAEVKLPRNDWSPNLFQECTDNSLRNQNNI